MKPKDYSLSEVYTNSFLSFIFEFYCSKETSFIVEDLSKICNKYITLTDKENVNPSQSTYVLLKEYSGVRPRYQFKTGFQCYEKLSTFLNTILFWLNENTSTDNSTLLKTKLFFDFNKLKTLNSISNMNVVKLLLKFNENYIYERLNNMNNNPSCMSIKRLLPYNMSVNVSNNVNVRNHFKIPINTYYGIDLTEQTLGEISFNYIGGLNYTEKIKEINEILQYYIITTYQSLNEYDFTQDELTEFNKLTENYRTFKKCYYNPKKFLNTYKDINLFIDLNNNEELIETQWFQIRDTLAKLILESDVRKCKFNLDTEEGTFQIKDAIINNCVIENLHIVDSKINGIINNCRLWQCDVNNSRIKNTVFVSENKISNCYLENVRADKDNNINESFIINNGEIINCKVNSSVIKNAGIGNLAKLDENCLIIHPKEKDLNPSKNGIDINEIRDYKWIKSLRDKNYKDLGFQNLYKEE